jgi:DNA-binding NarL/FixJ family response regulator
MAGAVMEDPAVPRNVLLVDDHAQFRQRTRQLFEAEGYTVVGEAEDGAAALQAAGRLCPDVVLLDVHLPDGLGFDLVPDLAKTSEVILISTHDEDAYRQRAARCGARGFITKDELGAHAVERLLA